MVPVGVFFLFLQKMTNHEKVALSAMQGVGPVCEE